VAETGLDPAFREEAEFQVRCTTRMIREAVNDARIIPVRESTAVSARRSPVGVMSPNPSVVYVTAVK
jgi:hypothetical protein